GNLASERAAQVEAWLVSDPSAADTLSQLTADDALTQALADPSATEAMPAATVDWVVQSVLQELRSEKTSSPDGTLALPAKLGSYRVVREIGRGGMGVVLEAEDEELQRRVALKVMARERAQDPAAKSRFLREARAAAAIEHENVVPIHHVGEDGGVPFL